MTIVLTSLRLWISSISFSHLLAINARYTIPAHQYNWESPYLPVIFISNTFSLLRYPVSDIPCLPSTVHTPWGLCYYLYWVPEPSPRSTWLGNSIQSNSASVISLPSLLTNILSRNQSESYQLLLPTVKVTSQSPFASTFHMVFWLFVAFILQFCKHHVVSPSATSTSPSEYDFHIGSSA